MTLTGSIKPGTETIRLTQQFTDLLYKFSKKKNTI